MMTIRCHANNNNKAAAVSSQSSFFLLLVVPWVQVCDRVCVSVRDSSKRKREMNAFLYVTIDWRTFFRLCRLTKVVHKYTVSAEINSVRLRLDLHYLTVLSRFRSLLNFWWMFRNEGQGSGESSREAQKIACVCVCAVYCVLLAI